MALGFFVITLGLLTISEIFFGNELSTLCFFFFSCFLSLVLLHLISQKRLIDYRFSIKRKSLYVQSSLAVLFLNLAICAPIYQIILSYFNRPAIALDSPFYGGYDMITVLAIAPFFEETIFKGIFLDGLLKKNRPIIPILFTAFLFSVLHLNLYLVTTIFLFAVFNGWLYYRTRNLALVIWVHILHNLIGSIEAYELQDIRAGFSGLERTYGGNSILLLPIFIVLFLISFYVLYKSINSLAKIDYQS